MVIAGAEGPKWRRSPVLDIGRREFITLLGGAAIFVYVFSRTFFPMAGEDIFLLLTVERVSFDEPLVN